MRTLAYCAASYVEATRRAAGVEPFVCPPLTAATFNPHWLENRDLLFFNFHSLAHVGAFLGSKDGPPVALRADQLNGLNLGGAVVFAESCFLGDEEHPMRVALLDAGASVVIAGSGKNWGSTSGRLSGADLLGLWLRLGLQFGLSVDRSLALAKKRLMLDARKSASARDALEFKIFRRSR